MAFADDDSVERDLGVLAPGGLGAKLVYDKVQRQELIENLLRRVEASRLPIAAKEKIGELALKIPRQLALHELMGTQFKGGKTRSGYFSAGGISSILRRLNDPSPDMGPLPPVSQRSVIGHPLRPPILQVGGTTLPFHPQTYQGSSGQYPPYGDAAEFLTGRPDIRRALWDYDLNNPRSVTSHEFGHGSQWIGGSNQKAFSDILDVDRAFNRALVNRYPSQRLTRPEMRGGELTARLTKPAQLHRLTQAAQGVTNELGAERTALTEGLLDAGVKRTEIPDVIRQIQITNPDWEISPPGQRIATMQEMKLIDPKDASRMASDLIDRSIAATGPETDLGSNIRWHDMPKREALDTFAKKAAKAARVEQGQTLGYRLNEGLEELLGGINVKRLLRKLL